MRAKNMNYCSVNTFPTFCLSQSHLQSITNNQSILTDLQEFVYSWKFKSQYDLPLINEDINNIISVIKDQFFEDQNDPKIVESVHCVVYNVLWDNLKSILKAKYARDDQILYEKSKKICRDKKYPKESAGNSYCSVPCTAAIVELSLWDSYNSPLEKLNCLCTTYDIIFAELKSALVTVISKYSEKEVEIPIINNKDVIPIISLVFIKSKLKYALSNVMYIKLFGQKWLEDNNKCYILQTFEQVIRQFLNEETQHSHFENCTTQCSDIDYCEVIEKMTLEETAPKQNESQGKSSLQDEHRGRLLSLIFTSTTSNETMY